MQASSAQPASTCSAAATRTVLGLQLLLLWGLSKHTMLSTESSLLAAGSWPWQPGSRATAGAHRAAVTFCSVRLRCVHGISITQDTGPPQLSISLSHPLG